MKWLVVLDPLDGLISKTDTSLALINKAHEKGIAVNTATIEDLFFDQCAAVTAHDIDGEARRVPLREYDLILMRKEPPYDLRFHYATQLLSLSQTLVVNRPSALRDYNEKLIVLPFIEHMPPTLVSSNPRLIEAFVTEHGQAVIKSLDSFQGRSVQKIEHSRMEVVGEFTEQGRKPVMVQKFLDAVFRGDKRVLTLGTEVIGAAMRRPKQGYHANFANSDALQTGLTEKEQRIMAQVGPWMVEQGIHFAGLDFIGEYLTEINITCPTGIVQVSELDGRDLAGEIVDYFIGLI
jgi:glutathione synthase